MAKRTHSGFTLVELLVTIGLISALIGLLLPSLSRARSTARATQCAANLHQITTAFFEYSTLSGGRLPTNLSTPSPGLFWYDDDRIGKLLPANHPPVPVGKPGGNVYICPEDPLPAFLSYSMNVWASSAIDSSVTSATPVSEIPWSVSMPRSSHLILLAESYSQSGAPATGWFAPATIGATGSSASARFGGSGGLAPPLYAKRWGYVISELNFMRHRIPGGKGTGTQPRGRLNIAYADGHVSMKSDTDLLDSAGASKGDSYWSAMDWRVP